MKQPIKHKSLHYWWSKYLAYKWSCLCSQNTVSLAYQTEKSKSVLCSFAGGCTNSLVTPNVATAEGSCECRSHGSANLRFHVHTIVMQQQRSDTCTPTFTFTNSRGVLHWSSCKSLTHFPAMNLSQSHRHSCAHTPFSSSLYAQLEEC